MADALRGAVAAAAAAALPEIQRLYDDWNQDDSGFDEEYGYGGICDAVADVLSAALASAGFATEYGGQEGDDHNFVVVVAGTRRICVDIPCGVYETGGGYFWRKRRGVVFGDHDIVVEEI